MRDRTIVIVSIIVVLEIVLMACIWFLFERRTFFDTHKRAMQITSAFLSNEMIPSRYTCDADNVSPPMTISAVPSGAQSLVLIVDDPDAPNGTWTHWVVWNIDPKTTTVAEGTVPSGGVEGVTSFGRPGWGGPCPPSGTHHYRFKLYALDVSLLPVSTSSTVDQVQHAMENHVIATVELVGLYKRS